MYSKNRQKQFETRNEPIEDKLTFAKFMTEKRIAAGLTQKDLADRLFLSDSTISKWERGISYPDITLISQICKELQITEHEFITASDDFTARTEKRQAKRYRNLVKANQIILCGGYAVALLTCFICNLAIQHTLDWFFIVLFSIALAFSITTLPVLLKKHRTLITFGAATVLTYLLIFTCSIYTGGDWFFSFALPVTTISMTIPWFVMAAIKYFPFCWELKTGIIVLFIGLFTSFINLIIDSLLGTDLTPYLWYFDVTAWQGPNMTNKIVFYILTLAGLVFTVIGCICEIRRRTSANRR